MLSIWVTLLLPVLISARASDGDFFNRPDFMSLNQCPVRGARMEFSVEEAFKKHRLVPDLIDVAPTDKLDMIYPMGIANLGNYIPLNTIMHMPYIHYAERKPVLYTLMFVSPDIPSQVFPQYRSYIYRLAVNYPGDYSANPDDVVPFQSPNIYPNSGEIRFVLIAFEQSERIDSTQPDIVRLAANRQSFNVREFASKYNLGNPVAGNFFISEATAFISTGCQCHKI